MTEVVAIQGVCKFQRSLALFLLNFQFQFFILFCSDIYTAVHSYAAAIRCHFHDERLNRHSLCVLDAKEDCTKKVDREDKNDLAAGEHKTKVIILLVEQSALSFSLTQIILK